MKASVLIVDDDQALRSVLGDRFRFWGHHVEAAAEGATAIEFARRHRFDLVLLDLAMPGMGGLDVLRALRADGCDAEIVVLTAHGSLKNAVEAMREGADDFLSKPAEMALLERLVERSLQRRTLLREQRTHTEDRPNFVVGPSASMQELLVTVDRVAATKSTVLLEAESGCGKQVLAEEIHRRSPQADGPFVYVNCVAISDELIESTLFGHERGAFTGALQRKEGRLEAASGGTAFLDEVGDISPSLQAKLLHFLESGEFERVGGNQTLRVDCRIVAATNRDLASDVEIGRFRRDLYYRLNVLELRIPPLRERPEDIVVLAEAFTEKFAKEFQRPGLRIAPAAMEIMRVYHWPGNVRQLKNVVERMAVLSPEPELKATLLPPELHLGEEESGSDAPALEWKEAVTRAKRHILRRALARQGGNQTKTAEVLGLQRSYLNRLLKDLDVE